MPRLERYRRTVGTTGAAVLGSMTAWAVATGRPVPVVGLAGLATLFLVGLAVPTVSDRVPQYQRTALVAIGLAAVGVLLLGHRFELAIAMALLGAASGIDLVVERFRAASR